MYMLKCLIYKRCTLTQNIGYKKNIEISEQNITENADQARFYNVQIEILQIRLST